MTLTSGRNTQTLLRVPSAGPAFPHLASRASAPRPAAAVLPRWLVSGCRPRRTSLSPPKAILEGRPEPVGNGDTDELWQRLRLLKRELDVCISEENFERAAGLRDEIKALSERLPVVEQYMHYQVDKLSLGDTEEKLRVIDVLGQTGNASVVPELAALLQDEKLQGATESAMWKIFVRTSENDVNDLMQQGIGLLSTSRDLPRCLEIFDEVIKRKPSFVEGFNKRATVLFLMQQYRQSIEDCEVVIEAQPYHFGALAGMGLCYFQLKEYNEAIKAFERALQVHPGLAQIHKLLEVSRVYIREQQ